MADINQHGEKNVAIGKNTGKIEFNYGNKKIDKFLASNVAKVNEEDFLGREDEIKEIRKRLTENKKLTLINGEGGIGKTTLAAKYWQDNQNNYKHLAWLFCDSGIIENLKTTLSQALNLDLKEIPEESQIDFLINKLNNLEKDCLLILDNANDKDELERFRTEFSGLDWHILLTSRCENVAENEYYIDHLPPNLAKELFKKNYDEKTDDFDELLTLFLESIGYNTLCIEIFSKTLKSSELLSMKELMDDLAAKGLFLDDKTEEIQVNWTSNTKKHKANTSDSIIKELYNISNWSYAGIYFCLSFCTFSNATFNALI